MVFRDLFSDVTHIPLNLTNNGVACSPLFEFNYQDLLLVLAEPRERGGGVSKRYARAAVLSVDRAALAAGGRMGRATSSSPPRRRPRPMRRGTGHRRVCVLLLLLPLPYALGSPPVKGREGWDGMGMAMR